MESESWLAPRPWPHLAIESTGAEATRMQNDTASKIHRKKNAGHWSGLDVTSSTDSMTSTHDFHALMCIYRHSNMFTLSLSLSADNSAIPCCPCCQTTSNLPCKKQRAHGDFVKANKHQQLLACVECAALKAWDNDTI